MYRLDHNPTDAELRAWWEEERKMQEFYDTPLGRYMRSALYLAHIQWCEHQAYHKQLLDFVERMPLAQPLSPPKP